MIAVSRGLFISPVFFFFFQEGHLCFGVPLLTTCSPSILFLSFMREGKAVSGDSFSAEISDIRHDIIQHTYHDDHSPLGSGW